VSESRASTILADPSAVDDATVVVDVVRGRNERFEVLIRRHNQQLFRVGMAYLRQRERVEDAMQNTYLKAWQNLARFEGGSAFSTWLTRIMINECLMQLRRQRASREVEGGISDALLEQRVDERHGATAAHRREVRALLEAAIAGLPENYRVVYMLREVQQLNTQDTATCVGITGQSVKVRLHRAREMLKNRLLASAAGAELFTFASGDCDRMTAEVMVRIRLAKGG
jgi:RNA polymerase sigma-70 factor (ECF subfamily)